MQIFTLLKAAKKYILNLITKIMEENETEKTPEEKTESVQNENATILETGNEDAETTSENELEPVLEEIGTIDPLKLKLKEEPMKEEKPTPEKTPEKEKPAKKPVENLPAVAKKDYTTLVVALIALVLTALLFWWQNRKAKKEAEQRASQETIDQELNEVDQYGNPI